MPRRRKSRQTRVHDILNAQTCSSRSDLVAVLPIAQEIFASSTPPRAQPEREATIVAIGIHPFLVGTPDGADALRRVVENFKNQKLVWVTDVKAVLDVADEKK